MRLVRNCGEIRYKFAKVRDFNVLLGTLDALDEIIFAVRYSLNTLLVSSIIGSITALSNSHWASEAALFFSLSNQYIIHYAHTHTHTID